MKSFFRRNFRCAYWLDVWRFSDLDSNQLKNNELPRGSFVCHRIRILHIRRFGPALGSQRWVRIDVNHKSSVQLESRQDHS